ncbi:hypothetical protein [Actinomadura welshii]|uniref:hypothetical protein n=1 Tax=Actinomadura welshii TaxID=3103817 RepID=UPI00126861DF|nr:hypothetical protein [Actinomadura madurae]
MTCRLRSIACTWSDSTALYESKTSVDGGRALTYVQVGGNPGLWKLDLKTGRRTRLTHNADWQEDHGDSPDGRWSVTTIDSRGSHYLDYLSLMPYRSFFDAWEISPVAIIAVGGAQRRVCAPFSPPAGGTLMGQDLHPYDGGDVRPSGNYQGWSMWTSAPTHERYQAPSAPSRTSPSRACTWARSLCTTTRIS